MKKSLWWFALGGLLFISLWLWWTGRLELLLLSGAGLAGVAKRQYEEAQRAENARRDHEKEIRRQRAEHDKEVAKIEADAKAKADKMDVDDLVDAGNTFLRDDYFGGGPKA